MGERGQNNGRETMTKRGREGGEAVLTGQHCIFFYTAGNCCVMERVRAVDLQWDKNGLAKG